MNVNKVLTKDYEEKTLGEHGKNEPKTNPIKAKTNPIKANFQKAQMNVNKVLTKDYENKLNWALYENEPNTNPIKANFKRRTYTAGNCLEYSFGTCKNKESRRYIRNKTSDNSFFE